MILKIARLFNCIAISRLKACSSNSLGDGPASFNCHRESRGKPFVITLILNPLLLPLCSYSFQGPSSSDFKVGSMLTHINESCVFTTSAIQMDVLLSGEIFSLNYVNSLEEWQAAKASESKQQKQQRYRKQRDSSSSDNVLEQISLEKNGFFAQGK